MSRPRSRLGAQHGARASSPRAWCRPARLRAAICAGGTRRAVAARPSLQFGDELVYIGTERQWAGVTALGRPRRPRNCASAPARSSRERLHVVIQKGRLFQREHPDVPVLVDKGRYLLVDIDPVLARRLAKRKEPCFSVRTLEALDTAARRRGPRRFRSA